MEKRQVKVIASFDFEGFIRPLQIEFEDGRKFEIDGVIDISRQHSEKLGITGIVYKCKIAGKEVTLYLEDIDYKRIPRAKWWV